VPVSACRAIACRCYNATSLANSYHPLPPALMQSDQLTAQVVISPPPSPFSYRLCFDHYFRNGAGTYDYLHFARSRGLFTLANAKQLEETYWRDLERNRSAFAAQLQEPFDLLVDPPSNSGYHRPYLSAFVRQLPRIPCLRFLKNTAERAHPDNIGILRACIKAMGSPQGQIGGITNVLIVDDVFSSGTIVTVVIEKLFEYGLPKDATITLACPLRMPPLDPTLAAILPEPLGS
jgi:hypothetical protein